MEYSWKEQENTVVAALIGEFMAERVLPFKTEGTFDSGKYAGILAAIFQHRVSGLLILTSGETVKKIFLENGSIAYASSNLNEDRLGDILLAKGIINREDYDKSSALIKETGKKQGTLLVQIGAMNPKELFRGLILQITEISESPFLWNSGRYQYIREHDKQDDFVTLKINPANIIREGLWRIPIADDLLKLENTKYRMNRDCAFTTESISLSSLDKKILSAVPRGRGPSDVNSFTNIPLRIVVKSFQVLTQLGFITPLEDEPAIEVEHLPQEKEVKPAATTRDTDYRNEIINFHQRLPKLTYYQILGLEPNSTSKDIKLAYIKKAKEFHPDHFYSEELEDISPLANEIFMKINEAYNALTDAKRRREYDQALIGVAPTVPKGASDLAIASEQFKKGVQLLKCGEHREASDSFRWAVRLNPDNPLYHSYLGFALMEAGQRLKEAEEHLKTAIALDYNNPQYYVILGLIYKKGKTLDNALTAFKRALKLDPHHKDALRELDLLPKLKHQHPDENSSLIKRLFGK